MTSRLDAIKWWNGMTSLEQENLANKDCVMCRPRPASTLTGREIQEIFVTLQKEK